MVEQSDFYYHYIGASVVSGGNEIYTGSILEVGELFSVMLSDKNSSMAILEYKCLIKYESHVVYVHI